MRGKFTKDLVILLLRHLPHKIEGMPSIVFIVGDSKTGEAKKNRHQYKGFPDIAEIIHEEFLTSRARRQEYRQSISRQYGKGRHNQDEMVAEKLSLPPHHGQ